LSQPWSVAYFNNAATPANKTNTPIFTGIFDTAYNELNGALNPIPIGGPRVAGGFPDGTSARRAQVGVRFVF